MHVHGRCEEEGGPGRSRVCKRHDCDRHAHSRHDIRHGTGRPRSTKMACCLWTASRRSFLTWTVRIFRGRGSGDDTRREREIGSFDSPARCTISHSCAGKQVAREFTKNTAVKEGETWSVGASRCNPQSRRPHRFEGVRVELPNRDLAEPQGATRSRSRTASRLTLSCRDACLSPAPRNQRRGFRWPRRSP